MPQVAVKAIGQQKSAVKADRTLGSLLRMNLILSACSIKSRFVYSVYRFCLSLLENRRQTACFAFILRKQPRLMGYSDLHFRQ